MTKLLGLMAFMWMLAVPSWSELPRMPSCLPPSEYAPSVVPNPEESVTFRCQNATPFDLIRAVGRQTRVPIGVAIGIHPTALLTIPHSYDLDRVQAKEAFSLASRAIGFITLERPRTSRGRLHRIIRGSASRCPRSRDLSLNSIVRALPVSGLG